jgi:short-subunit dehydrogenase
VNVTMITLPRMLERGAGDLINFASMAGWIPLPHFGAYNASKFAVVAFTEVLAHENRGRGIRFACVCPPPVATPLLDQAHSRPRVLKVGKPIAPEVVLDAIERELDAGELMVFPTSQSKQGVRVRRFLPDLLWNRLHKLERLP